MAKKIIYWIPVVAWMGVIYYFSSRPTFTVAPFDLWDFIVKKTAHFVEYFILSFLTYLAIRRTTTLSRSSCLFFTIFSSISYAISDEYHQSFVYGRESRIRDVLIDSFGASVSLYFSNLFVR